MNVKLKSNWMGCLALGAGLFLCSCVTVAKNPQEFREKTPGAMFGKTKKTDVNKSYAVLSAMLQRKAKECLNGGVIEKECRNYSCSETTNTVETVVASSKGRTELVTRYKLGRKMLDQPEEGMIYLVADLIPVDARNSRLEFYYGYAARFVDAIETWAQGEERGCPDLTRILER